MWNRRLRLEKGVIWAEQKFIDYLTISNNILRGKEEANRALSQSLAYAANSFAPRRSLAPGPSQSAKRRIVGAN